MKELMKGNEAAAAAAIYAGVKCYFEIGRAHV